MNTYPFHGHVPAVGTLTKNALTAPLLKKTKNKNVQ